ncbi:alpha-amylase family glycosyl hydrolase [Limnospira platensis]|jgi:sucrose phosphorylase|uniref:Alpha amylase n=3 Tax=Sirenicapillariaceae TaxID=2934961 RepID=E3VS06_LIMPL|nr:alpha-amylase family glycosyl hydrolase [Arthrospira platensis]ADO34179.2 alpha amylase [Arthrospira platensis AV]AMW28124.1 alpha-amylase [Arthrospira platensis YZ]KDR57259.1 alpha-amylase [Arthrospira platensis str. Paraca]MBD2574729.1 alpha-amylase [Arthrospira platensis FACHB-971]MBD2711719.1 alpha-amylase [Arthrospira platensis FACHB-835]MDF2209245.1 alpha-amylase family glycosyl hydrolase [Arthrospira platensis NCB002]MDT9296511.1 alpha-amylase family glycosyl hydrolase [Arthrospira
MKPMRSTDSDYQYFCVRLQPLLEIAYEPATIPSILDRLFAVIGDNLYIPNGNENPNKWTENNVTLITYGDSICSRDTDQKPLEVLAKFLGEHLQDTITGVHILPFFPYTSDDGFAVSDYLSVNRELGDWEDIKTIASQFNLMVDVVLNHVSSKHQWFQQFQAGEKPGSDYFIVVEPETDLSEVVRPRNSPVLVKVETVHGEKHVWATFSEDQIDVNFANPDVLIEFLKIIRFYIVNAKARYIRLDAVGFMWKEIGTSCIHLPPTHAIIKLLRELVNMIDPEVALITETNVPNRENLSYFGNRNEAHMIYNFSLPPLLLNAMLQGKSDHLKTWMMSMPPAPLGCAYFNFTASHDGIGLRPAEGLLSDDEYQSLLTTMEKLGGKISMRKKPDGSESPYEINISLFDAMKGTVKGEDTWQIQRFICSQTLMMSLEGIPAFYIHSLLATPNDYDRLKETGMNRSINRYKWQIEDLQKDLENPHSPRSLVFREICRRIKIRRQQGAFHPNATQYTLQLKRSLFGFWRQSMTRDQSIFCIFNLTDKPQQLNLRDVNLICIDPWLDLISGEMITDIYSKYILQPYQAVWITNKF